MENMKQNEKSIGLCHFNNNIHILNSCIFRRGIIYFPSVIEVSTRTFDAVCIVASIPSNFKCITCSQINCSQRIFLIFKGKPQCQERTEILGIQETPVAFPKVGAEHTQNFKQLPRVVPVSASLLAPVFFLLRLIPFCNRLMPSRKFPSLTCFISILQERVICSGLTLTLRTRRSRAAAK